MEDMDIIYRKTVPLSDPTCSYPGFKQESKIISKGTECKKGYIPLKCDIFFERDVEIEVRDRTKLYADIFRPVTDEKVPVILNSTTFGKSRLDVPWGSLTEEEAKIYQFPGVLKSMTSGLNSFESTDPGFFVPHGYAVVNLDIRGCYMSGGKAPYFGTQEAEDDYDVIEWLAAQEWCNGCVAMTGNSWLGINQWFAGAQQPPHLTCLAPWEGWSDMYRDEYMVGGIPNLPGYRFNNSYKDNGEMEDVVANCLAHPLFDKYWQDKQADLDKISVPLYATASYTSPVHCQGTIYAWRHISSKEKWLRIHHRQEWFDTYSEDKSQDLLKFFDYYMKGMKDNGWNQTPRVRMSVLDPGGEDIVERPENEFPLKRQENQSLYLNSENMSLDINLPTDEASVSYCGWDHSKVSFTYTFEDESEIVGYINAKLWVESDGYNDMDLFVKITKTDADGNELFHYPIPGNNKFQGGGYSGPASRQRVSLRKLDCDKSTENEPYHTFDESQKLLPYDIVPVEIGLFPTGMRFHKGEKLEFSVSGYPMSALPGGSTDKMHVNSDNNGNHIIHTGGHYDSKLIIPFIPLKK